MTTSHLSLFFVSSISELDRQLSGLQTKDEKGEKEKEIMGKKMGWAVRREEEKKGKKKEEGKMKNKNKKLEKKRKNKKGKLREEKGTRRRKLK